MKKAPLFDRIEGCVWCHIHGSIHENTTDPFGTGEPECRESEHRLVYARTRKGDYPMNER